MELNGTLKHCLPTMFRWVFNQAVSVCNVCTINATVVVVVVVAVMTMMIVGSAVATYTSLTTNPAVLLHAIPLYVQPVTMSLTSMTAQCRDRYKSVLTDHLLKIVRTDNYQLCTKALCSYMTGTPGAGAAIGESEFGTLQMYVAIDSTALSSAVKLDYNPSTVTCLL